MGNGLALATSARNEVVLSVASGDAAALGVPRSTPTPQVWGTTAFVARFRRSDGRLLRARNLELQPGGENDSLFADGCAVSDAGSVAVVGSFRGRVDLGTGPLSAADVQGFLLRAVP